MPLRIPFVHVWAPLLGGLCGAVNMWGQFVYTESFTGETTAGWEFVRDSSGTEPAARLTAEMAPTTYDPEYGNSSIDASGNGWLRLATTRGNQANAVALDTAIPSASNSIKIGFDYTMWGGGSGPADGLTLFLWDAGVEFDAGAYGGSLGYAQRTDIAGLSGGYIGIGLDVYGNYSNDQKGRSGAYDGTNLPDALKPILRRIRSIFASAWTR